MHLSTTARQLFGWSTATESNEVEDEFNVHHGIKPPVLQWLSSAPFISSRVKSPSSSMYVCAMARRALMEARKVTQARQLFGWLTATECSEVEDKLSVYH
jgi:hypothetical protein